MSHDAEFEVAVHMHNFHNLDLFQQGWYEVKVTCFWEDAEREQRAGQPSRVVQYGYPDVKRGEANTVWRIDDAESSFHTRPFRIRYSRQDVLLQEMVSFHLKVGKENPVEDCVIVKFELLFGAQNKNLAVVKPPEEMKAISEHSFRLMSGDWNCMHQFVPVTFDTCHFVFLEVNVHAVLLTFKRSINFPQAQTGLTENLSVLAQTTPGSPIDMAWQEPQKLSGTENCSHGEVRTKEGETGIQDAHVSGAVEIGEDKHQRVRDKTITEENRKRIDLPSAEDLDLLGILLVSHRKLTDELTLYLQKADERAVKLPVFKKSELRLRLQKVLASHGHYENTDSESGDLSSEEGSTASPGSSRNGRHSSNLFQKSVMRFNSFSDLGDVDTSGEASLSVDEYEGVKQELSQQLGMLWNFFLTLHKLHPKKIGEVLRRRWEESRAGDAAQWVVESPPAPEMSDRAAGEGEDWSGLWRDTNVAVKEPPPEKAVMSASRAGLYRSGLVDAKCKFVPFQDLQIFANPAAQPIVFVEHTAGPPAEDLDTTTSQREGSHMRDGSSSADVDYLKPEGTHVVVFVHGFQGHHLDLRLLRNHWILLNPGIECLMSETNEDRTFDNFAEMGRRLAEEVVRFVDHMFGSAQHPPHPKPYRRLTKLSFVGHSIGNISIRAALADEALRPYLPFLYTFLSISAPHLGYLYSNNNIFNGGLWVLKKLHNKAAVMHELTLTDAPRVEDCYMYRLAQDRYVPYHSARIELCPAALRDSKHGAAYAAMVNGCLGPIPEEGATRKQRFVRCDVNFDVTNETKNLNTFIGRKAHIDFLETDVYVRFILWAYKESFL